jgi:ADP-heptose:LPS heptosyltransferase
VTDGSDQRIFVLFPGALGDFMCFLPTLQDLAQRAAVDLFARRAYADLAPRNVQVWSLERYEINKLFVAEAVADDSLRSFFTRYDSVYSWMGGGERLFVSQLQELCRGRAHIFPFQPETSGQHQTEYYLSCVHGRGAPTPQISLQSSALAGCDTYWARYSLEGSEVLIVAPGSGAVEKNWPPAFFAAVIGWWRNEIGGRAVVALGPVEEERGGLEAVLSAGCAVARDMSLAQLAAFISRADLYLGNDSGVTHMAAALGVPTVALFGPSDPQRWRPQGKRVSILRHPTECAPCSVTGMKSCDHRKCLRMLKPSEVIRELTVLREQSRLDKEGGRD